MSHRQWRGIPLADLVQRELAPYATSNNTEIGGPEVMLTAAAGQAMATVLHELVTNAAKHGALSTREGRVSVRWYQPLNGGGRDRLVIEWQESGGPAVETPSKSGYGTGVIADLLPYELGGAVDLAYASDGCGADWKFLSAGLAAILGMGLAQSYCTIWSGHRLCPCVTTPSNIAISSGRARRRGPPTPPSPSSTTGRQARSRPVSAKRVGWVERQR